MKPIACVFGAVVVCGLVAVDSQAARCGGERPCACGDHVVEDYRLLADIGPCAKDGLRIEARVTLDGAGHAIRGPGATGVGLRVGVEGNGSQVRDLSVSGFEHGVRLIGARGVRIEGVEAHGNGDPGERVGYGIDLSAGASENVLERVRVHDNADEGIHVGSNATANRIVDSDVFGNGRENVYFLACRDNRLERSRVRSKNTANASIYIKFATGTVLEGNEIDGGSVQIRGAARDTVLSNNTLRGASVILQAQNDRRFGSGSPSGTILRGGSITAPEACVRIDSASETRVEDVALSCASALRIDGGSRVTVRSAKAAKGELRIQCAGPGEVEEIKAGKQAPAHTLCPGTRRRG